LSDNVVPFHYKWGGIGCAEMKKTAILDGFSGKQYRKTPVKIQVKP
jgi:hypothetical protein